MKELMYEVNDEATRDHPFLTVELDEDDDSIAAETTTAEEQPSREVEKKTANNGEVVQLSYYFTYTRTLR